MMMMTNTTLILQSGWAILRGQLDRSVSPLTVPLIGRCNSCCMTSPPSARPRRLRPSKLVLA